MNPFDLKSALLAKHAQHVVLIHFPIALFLTGAALDLAAAFSRQVTRRAAWVAAARLNFVVAAAFVLPTVATGIMAWQWQFGGKRPKGFLLLHLTLACLSSLLISLVGWIQFRRRRVTSSSSPAHYLMLEGFTAALVILTAHIGGFLSGVNVPG